MLDDNNLRMKQNNLIFIGPINKGNIACTGDTVKNQLFLKRFSELFRRIIAIDTYNWKKRPWCIIQLLSAVLFYNKANIIVSTNPGSADMVVRILNRLQVSHRTFYWVVGGSLHKSFENGNIDWRNYTQLSGIFVQGTSMEKSMRKLGLNNVKFVPNSKYIDYLPTKHIMSHSKTHFVFLSRIEKYKGCNDIFEAIEILHNKGYKGKFDVTFYGKTTDELEYFDLFQKAIERFEDVEYKGVLNLRDVRNYNELSKYDVMLFPTYWPGEGFPGVIIDAYIAGLPVIASDWNLNTDVVRDNETGWIVPTHDMNALANKMMYAIDQAKIVEVFSYNSQKKAKEYDSRIVLSEDNLKELGVL